MYIYTFFFELDNLYGELTHASIYNLSTQQQHDML
jgi:hypothetical protein